MVSLWKIANGLRVPFTAFLKKETSEATLRAFREDKPLKGASEGYRLFPLVSFGPERSFEVYYVEIDPETTLDAEAHQGNAEGYVFVVQGKIDITIEDRCYAVDSDHFINSLANRSHRYQNSDKETAVAIMLISYLA